MNSHIKIQNTHPPLRRFRRGARGVGVPSPPAHVVAASVQTQTSAQLNTTQSMREKDRGGSNSFLISYAIIELKSQPLSCDFNLQTQNESCRTRSRVFELVSTPCLPLRLRAAHDLHLRRCTPAPDYRTTSPPFGGLETSLPRPPPRTATAATEIGKVEIECRRKEGDGRVRWRCLARGLDGA